MNNLVPMEFENQRIMTTKVLAECYEAKEKNIKENFNNNKERFIEGKHYYKLTGDKLREFKCEVDNIDLVAKNVNVLYIWTEKGALRHAKMLNTDKAWDIYEELEETYFKVREIISNNQLVYANEEIRELKNSLESFRALTEEAKEMYKPSHKRKLQYDRLIKGVTADKEEYLIVKEWIFAVLEIEKWEDTSIDQNKKILEIISTVSNMLNIKKFEQLRLL